ncbi:MAG: hypothetical protein MRY21_08310 [Simkaniaceae bacterium]|nr:hypothetical protein [Simkaniaceae bacterium]
MQNNRLKAIEDLIVRFEIGDQNTLVDALKEHYAIETNQAAVSRDLHKLGITKIKSEGKLIYQKTGDPQIEILKLGVERIVHNEAMIVVHTLAGLADFVGDYIDEQDLPILGTIAGENTIFVTPSSTNEIKQIFETLCEALYYQVQS